MDRAERSRSNGLTAISCFCVFVAAMIVLLPDPHGVGRWIGGVVGLAALVVAVLFFLGWHRNRRPQPEA